MRPGLDGSLMERLGTPMPTPGQFPYIGRNMNCSAWDVRLVDPDNMVNETGGAVDTGTLPEGIVDRAV